MCVHGGCADGMHVVGRYMCAHIFSVSRRVFLLALLMKGPWLAEVIRNSIL